MAFDQFTIRSYPIVLKWLVLAAFTFKRLILRSNDVTLNQRVPGSSPGAPTKFHQPSHRLTRRLVYCRRASFDGRFHPGSTVRPLALLQHVTCALAPITVSQRSSATSVSLKRAR